MDSDNYLMRIYNLPYPERKALCRLLDLNDKWEELGGMCMGIDVLTLQYFRKKPSPTDELLTHWGMLNHTVLELFILLSRMQNYQAMMVLKPLVNPKYHVLIYEGEENLSQLFASHRIQKHVNNNCTLQRQNHMPSAPSLSGKDLDIAANNLNLNDATGSTIAMKNPLAGVMEEIKINNTHFQNRENNNSTAPTIRADHNSMPHRDHSSVSVVNNELANGGNHVRPVSPQQRKLSNASTVSSNAESGTPLINYSELEAATNSWDRSCILGRGGFGTVYKGTWKNTLVAIKKLETQKDNMLESMELQEAQRQQSLRELKYLNSCRHDNILPLYGYSVGGEASCLVYQFMINGSLEDRLMCRLGTKPLSWTQRHNIATGTARGLQFLHSVGDKPLVHGDIKSANILLDPYFEPRIGDFGLAREGPLQQYTHVKVSRVHGTRPYLPEEFLRGKKFSTKVDTFSFGIVLFELATGQRAYEDNRSQKFLKDYVEAVIETDLGKLADPKAGPDECSIASGLLILGRCCVRYRSKERPDMVVVLHRLNTMANTRDMVQRAQCLVRQNSLTPSNPYEMQLVHDHLSQQRKLTPPITQKMSPSPNHSPIAVRSKQSTVDATPPYIPLQCHVASPQQQGLGLLCYATPQQISPNTPVHNGLHQNAHHLSPEQSGYPYPLVIHHPPIQAPQINVSPPSRPDFSGLLPAQPLEVAMPFVLENKLYINTENNTAVESPLTPCDDLPLMTELGIKPHETVHSNSSNHLATTTDILSSSSS